MLLTGNGTFLTQIGHESRGPLGYGLLAAAPPERVVQATLALEDRRFWSSRGSTRWRWSAPPGSTWPAAGAPAPPPSPCRWRAMQHPRRAPAAQGGGGRYRGGAGGALRPSAVLAQYLRRAPYGDNSHGVAHAARCYFDRPAGDLSWAETALLAAVPQAPALRRRARVAMRAAPPAAPNSRWRCWRGGTRCRPWTGSARAELAWPALVPVPRRPAALQVVLRLHDRVRSSARRTIRPIRGCARRSTCGCRPGWRGWRRRIWRVAGGRRAAGGGDGGRRSSREVLADVASAGYDSRPGGAIDFSAAQRSPGSTLKPFLYARALDRGKLAAADVLADLPEGAPGINNADDAFLGNLLPRQALANSRNVPAANLLRRIGLGEGFGFLRDLGLHRLDGPAERFGLAMAIGALPTSLDRLVGAYATLAEDGMAADLVWLEGQRGAAPRRLISADSARLVTRFLSDPMARLPSFPRYGASEFPFAVALKTGTSQGYRDAWTVAWSQQYLVGVWVGRADAGPMTRLSGARAAGRLAQAVLMGLHGAGRTDLLAGEFAAPPGRAPAELCTGTGALAGAACAGRLTEWVKPGEAAGVRPPAAAPRLTIVTPEPDTHLWRNPEAPPALNRLVPRAAVEPKVAQIVWLVDGRPVAVAAPDAPVYWNLTPGRHRFQIRLPLQADVSRAVSVVVE